MRDALAEHSYKKRISQDMRGEHADTRHVGHTENIHCILRNVEESCCKWRNSCIGCPVWSEPRQLQASICLTYSGWNLTPQLDVKFIIRMTKSPCYLRLEVIDQFGTYVMSRRGHISCKVVCRWRFILYSCSYKRTVHLETQFVYLRGARLEQYLNLLFSLSCPARQAGTVVCKNGFPFPYAECF